MFWLGKDIIYIVNANSEVQKLKSCLGWPEGAMANALSAEYRLTSLLARGVVDFDAFYLSRITQRVSLFHRLLFKEGLLQFSVEGNRSFKESLDLKRSEYPLHFEAFHRKRLSDRLLSMIAEMGIPYARPGSSGTVLANRLKEPANINVTEELISVSA